MTAILNNIESPLGNKYIEDSSVNGTVQENVTSAASTIYYISVDNSNNNAAVYFKLWDSASPDVSTDSPNFKFKINASSDLTLMIPEGLSMTTGISYACVTTSQNGVSGNPVNDVSLKIITS